MGVARCVVDCYMLLTTFFPLTFDEDKLTDPNCVVECRRLNAIMPLWDVNPSLTGRKPVCLSRSRYRLVEDNLCC